MMLRGLQLAIYTVTHPVLFIPLEKEVHFSESNPGTWARWVRVITARLATKSILGSGFPLPLSPPAEKIL
jgi:hypothetical protein